MYTSRGKRILALVPKNNVPSEDEGDDGLEEENVVSVGFGGLEREEQNFEDQFEILEYFDDNTINLEDEGRLHFVDSETEAWERHQNIQSVESPNQSDSILMPENKTSTPFSSTPTTSNTFPTTPTTFSSTPSSSTATKQPKKRRHPKKNTRSKAKLKVRREVVTWIWERGVRPTFLVQPPEETSLKGPEVLTKLEYFQQFFPEKAIDLIVERTNTNSIQKTGKCINTNSMEIRDLLAIELLMSIIVMPSVRDYWSTSLRNEKIASVMTLNRYIISLKRFLHFNDNSKLPSEDRYYKIRPLSEIVRKQCMSVPHENAFSIDEMMAPYKGKRAGSRRQYNKDKPKKWGFKLFVRAGVSGIVYDFYFKLVPRKILKCKRVQKQKIPEGVRFDKLDHSPTFEVKGRCVHCKNGQTAVTCDKCKVQGTNDSSILSKYSMVLRGYFDDEAIKHFVTRDARRSPLIHLGYYARAIVMDYAIKSFVEASLEKNPQILSLGAGFDTTYFRLSRIFPSIVYFEVDLPDVVDNKISIIKNAKELNSILADVTEKGFNFTCLKSRNYNIFTHDLSDTSGLDEKLAQMGFDFERPTLLFSECAITYIENERSTALIEWIKHRIEAATLLNYEQFNPDDGFGKVMVAHFTKIQNPLKSLTKYRTMEEQHKRYSDAGWKHCKVCSVMDLFQRILKREDAARAFRIEPFDEWEELHLKCCHYSLAIASHSEDFLASFPDSKHDSAIRKTLVMSPIDENVVERYAHSCVELSDKGILVIGGFGSNVHRHGRSKEIIYVGTTCKDVTESSQDSSVTWDCLYATCTAIGNDEFIIIGGRTSPAREVNFDPVLVKALIGELYVELSSADIPLENKNRPPPRWRHAAVHHQQSLLVYGGRNKELQVFGDLWELRSDDGVTWKWSQRTCQVGCGPCGRFSHAMTTGCGKIYMTGGLDAQMRPLDDVWELDINESVVSWRAIKPLEPIPAMYSHTLHYHQHQLIFIGGVNTSPSNQPGLTILDLDTLQPTLYILEATVPRDAAVMLHNHSSVLTSEDSTITCYGGGGNCFSFGTHFNRHPLKIRLT